MPPEALQVPFQATTRFPDGISVPSFLPLPLGENSHVASNRSKTTIQKVLAAELKLPLAVVEKAALLARTSSSGDSSEIELEKLEGETFKTFAEKSGVLIADLGPALSAGADDRARLIHLEDQMRMVCGKLEEQGIQLKRQDLELTILRHSNESYATVLRRCLVEETHNFLVKTAGPRLVFQDNEVEQWTDYIDRKVEELGTQWFKERKLPFSCLTLLPKGPNTPFQLGNDAAHKLRTLQPDLFCQTYLVGLSEEEQPAWKKLYGFVSTLT